MFSHVMLGVNDLEVSKKFYDALLGTLGYGPGVANKNRYFYRSPTGTFAISTPINGEPANHGNGSTIGFTVKSPEQPAKTHLDFAKAQPASFILLTCAIQTATRFALCTALARHEISHQHC
jgi:catechol 2,3-dioxygenase-like lactoylglutathione lyase family enzyme